MGRMHLIVGLFASLVGTPFGALSNRTGIGTKNGCDFAPHLASFDPCFINWRPPRTFEAPTTRMATPTSIIPQSHTAPHNNGTAIGLSLGGQKPSARRVTYH